MPNDDTPTQAPVIGLEVRGVSKKFGTTTVLQDTSLSLPLGQFACFVGPSGCGKTTLLRLIAGLEQPSSGQILLNGRDVTNQPAHERRFGMVFQSLALFPHLTVAGNIEYSLKLRGVRAKERRPRVEELLALIRLPHIADRPIATLSGGQRQRVAIARALAQEPAVFLLDEPFSALDAKLREEMQVELRLLQQQLKITTILVTHDQREAMTLGDRVVVMDRGAIQQTGTPTEIYRQPANRFVAGFFGPCNLLPAGRAADGAVTLGAGPLTLAVRPEDLLVRAEGAPPVNGSPCMAGTLVLLRDLGSTVEAMVTCGDHQIRASGSPASFRSLGQGSSVLVQVADGAGSVLER